MIATRGKISRKLDSLLYLILPVYKPTLIVLLGIPCSSHLEMDQSLSSLEGAIWDSSNITLREICVFVTDNCGNNRGCPMFSSQIFHISIYIYNIHKRAGNEDTWKAGEHHHITLQYSLFMCCCVFQYSTQFLLTTRHQASSVNCYLPSGKPTKPTKITMFFRQLNYE